VHPIALVISAWTGIMGCVPLGAWNSSLFLHKSTPSTLNPEIWAMLPPRKLWTVDCRIQSFWVHVLAGDQKEPCQAFQRGWLDGDVTL